MYTYLFGIEIVELTKRIFFEVSVIKDHKKIKLIMINISIF
jgi:hypothetical protein